MSTLASSREPATQSAWLGWGVLFLLSCPVLAVRGVPVGLAVFAVTLPVFVSELAVPGWHRRLVGWITVALVTSPLLLLYSLHAVPGRGFVARNALLTLEVFLVALACLIAGSWALRRGGTRPVLLAMAAGALVSAVLGPPPTGGNPWKYAVAWPLTLLVLTVFHRTWHAVLVLPVVAAVSVAYDFRSFAGQAAVALLIVVVWGRGRRREPQERRASQRVSWMRTAVALVLVVGAVQVGMSMALAGNFGDTITTRTRTQAQDASNVVELVLNARGEYRLALGLVQQQVVGFGPGLKPTAEERSAATAYFPPDLRDSDYVVHYLLAERYMTHSVLWDTWISLGILGFVSMLLLAWVMVRGLLSAITRGIAESWQVMAVLVGLWDLLFSPLTNLPHVVAGCLAVLVLVRTSREQETDSTPEPEPAIAHA